jgi:hypothetical protein
VRRARKLLVSFLVYASLSASAQGAQSAKLDVSFTPHRLGHSTTVNLSFEIAAASGRVPSPLTGLDVSYPSDLGIDASGLGLATCSPATLAAQGPRACPADARMGHGTALAEIPIGAEIIRETADVEILRAPGDGEFALLFYVNGENPVDAPIIFSGLLLPGPGSDESIQVNVPLIPSFPEAPDVAVTRLQTTLGPRGLTYYEHVHGRLLAYRPQGILLPKRCPRGGFAFRAAFSFLDGSHALAHAVVPCRVDDTPRQH